MTLNFIFALVSLLVALAVVAMGEHAKTKVPDRVVISTDPAKPGSDVEAEQARNKIHLWSRICAAGVVTVGFLFFVL